MIPSSLISYNYRAENKIKDNLNIFIHNVGEISEDGIKSTKELMQIIEEHLLFPSMRAMITVVISLCFFFNIFSSS